MKYRVITRFNKIRELHLETKDLIKAKKVIKELHKKYKKRCVVIEDEKYIKLYYNKNHDYYFTLMLVIL